MKINVIEKFGSISMKFTSMKVKIFIIIKMQSLKLHNNKDLDVIHNKKKSLHTCDIYYRGSGSV